MRLTELEYVALGMLDAIELLDELAQPCLIELQLASSLGAVGIATHAIDGLLVARALLHLERSGQIESGWCRAHVDEHGRPHSDAVRVWVLTPAGEHRLERLRGEAGDTFAF